MANTLPDSVLLEVFSYLNPNERRLHRATCRAWKSILEEFTLMKVNMNHMNVLEVLNASQNMSQIMIKMSNLTNDLIGPENIEPSPVPELIHKLLSVELVGDINSRILVKLMEHGDQIRELKFKQITKFLDMDYLNNQLKTMNIRPCFPNLENLTVPSDMTDLKCLEKILDNRSLKHICIEQSNNSFYNFIYRDPFEDAFKLLKCPIDQILKSNRNTLITLLLESFPSVDGSSNNIMVKFHEFDESQKKQRIHSFISTGNLHKLHFYYWINQLKKQTELKTLRLARIWDNNKSFDSFKKDVLEVASNNWQTLEYLYIQNNYYSHPEVPQTIHGCEWHGSEFSKLTSLKHLCLHYFPQTFQPQTHYPIFHGIRQLPPSIKTLHLSNPINLDAPQITHLQPFENLVNLEILKFDCKPWFLCEGKSVKGGLSIADMNHLRRVFPGLKELVLSGSETVTV